MAGDLRRICDTLNDSRHPAQRDALRGLFLRWKALGSNLGKLWETDEALEKEMRSAWVGRLEVDGHGKPHIVLKPGKWRTSSAHGYAVGLFVALTLNSEAHRIGGPCAYSRCGQFFLERRKSGSRYCSRRCCQAQSATQHTKRRLVEAKRDKLRRVEAAIKVWLSSRKRSEWKSFVCKLQPDITSKFLTRAVNNGDIADPQRSEMCKSL